MDPAASSPPVRVIGRYALYEEIAAGGMATVHFGRLLGPVGFSRTVAVKRLHPQYAKDPEFVSMFLDEARLAARIRHPNVVPTLDVVATQGELFLVMEYVQGESLARLIRSCRERNVRMPVRVIASILSSALHGLHAAHEARNERGEPLGIVHRDVSPHNILVGIDGVTRVLDFGVAKAAGRIQTTREGQLKGKIAYMAPEQLSNSVSRQTDVYAAAICLWEALTSERLFTGDSEAAVLTQVIKGNVEPPSRRMIYASETENVPTRELLDALDAVTLRGLATEPAARYATAREMAIALERAAGLAPPSEVGEWVEHSACDILHERAVKIAEIESSSSVNLSNLPALADEMAATADAEAHTRAARMSQPSLPSLESSQLSSISVSKQGDPSRSNQDRRLAALAAVLGLLAVALIAALVFLTSRKAEKARASEDPMRPASGNGNGAGKSPAPVESAVPTAAALSSATTSASAMTTDAVEGGLATGPSAPPTTAAVISKAPGVKPVGTGKRGSGSAGDAAGATTGVAASPGGAKPGATAAAPVQAVQPCTAYMENGIKKYRGNCE